MNVTCPECRSVFRIDPAKVPESGVRARCNVCGAVIPIEHANVLVVPTHIDASRATADAALPAAVTVPASAPSDPMSAREPASISGGGPASPVATSSTAAPGAPPARSAGAQPDARPRPVNPYLNNTPELRARRLARALVSDLVAYNPQKREEGLRDGTLRQLFRDEIRKSWDEYVEQVGANVAESTPHFQDALNDVLAGGRRVF